MGNLCPKNRRDLPNTIYSSSKEPSRMSSLAGKLIDKAHVEPLHLKNNAWGYFFKVLLKEAVAKSNIPATCKTFAEVPQDTCLGRVVNALKCEVKAGRLAKKV